MANTAGAEVNVRCSCAISSSSCFFFKAACNCLRVVSKTISSSSSSGSAGLVAGQAGPVEELITKVVGAEITAGAELGVVTKVDGQVLSIVAGAELVSRAGAQLMADIAGAGTETTALAKGTKFDSDVAGTQVVSGLMMSDETEQMEVRELFTSNSSIFTTRADNILPYVA